MKLAYARPLNPEHLFPLPASSETAGLLDRFRDAWGQQLAKPKGERRCGMMIVMKMEGRIESSNETLKQGGFVADGGDMRRARTEGTTPPDVHGLLSWFE